MINFFYNDNTLKGTIILDGKLTLENLAVLKKSFIDALTKTDHLVVDHTKADEFDFAYLLLLLSIIKTSEQSNKKFTVKSSPENLKQLLIKSGFADINLFSRIFLN
jgi:anti-anti-sigma regulatory factor